MYSNSILTEGIACSLFLIFIRYLLEFYYRRRMKSLVIASALSFILIATRKQMYITLMLLIIVAGWCLVEGKKYCFGIVSKRMARSHWQFCR